MRIKESHLQGTQASSFFIIALSVSILLSAFLLSELSIPSAILVAVGFSIFVLTFASTRLAIYLLIFSMLLSPEFGAVSGGVAEGRSIVVRFDDILLVVISLSWLARLAIVKERLGLFRRTPLGRPIASYVSVVAIATIMGMIVGRVQPVSGFFYTLKYVEYIIVFYMIVNHLETTEQAKNIIKATFITCAIICLYAIYQIPAGGRVTAPFEGEGGEPNTLGGYLVLMLSMISGLLLTTRRHREKVTFALLGILIIIPLMYTLSRSSWIALVPMYVTFLAFSTRKFPLVITAALFICLSPFLLPEQVVDRAVTTFEEEKWNGTTERIAGVAFDPSTSERISRYRRSLGRWTRHPMLGYGVTGGGFIDGQFLRTLEETGLIGLTVMLWLLFYIFRAAHKNYLRLNDPFFGGLSLGLMGGVAALLGHAVGSSTFIIVRIMEPFWLMVAIVVRAPHLSRKEPDEPQIDDAKAQLKERLRDERPIEREVVR
ncbi:MAG: O-antigen ligase family protein [Candidatus Glassbacteria bacterium]